MTAQPQGEALPIVFERGSPVHAYWVDRCVGFAVVDAQGRRLGRVRDAQREEDELVVARRFRTRRIATAAVQAVWPHDRVILLSDSAHEGRVEQPAAGAVGEDTLPWFDLVGGAARRESSRRATLERIRGSSRSVGETIVGTLGSSIRAALSATRRRSRLFRAWLDERIHDARRRCARALVRLAGIVEPRSHDA